MPSKFTFIKLSIYKVSKHKNQELKNAVCITKKFYKSTNIKWKTQSLISKTFIKFDNMDQKIKIALLLYTKIIK